MLTWLLEALQSLTYPVFLAIPLADELKLAKLASEYGATLYTGSENDVLDRYYRCAKEHQLERVVRMTGDNPLTAWEHLETVIKHMENEGKELAWPLGLAYGSGFEIFSFRLLKNAWQNSVAPYDREHVSPYIHRNASCATIRVANQEGLRTTVDTESDFIAVEKILKERLAQ